MHFIRIFAKFIFYNLALFSLELLFLVEDEFNMTCIQNSLQSLDVEIGNLIQKYEEKEKEVAGKEGRVAICFIIFL